MKNNKILIGALIIIAVILIGVIGVLCVMNFGGGASSNVSAHLKAADKSFESGDYEAALVSYRIAVENDPDSPDGYYGLARTYIELKRLNDAKVTLTNGISRTGSDKLKQLYNSYFGENADPLDRTDDGSKIDSATLGIESINRNLCQNISNFTYADYTEKYGVRISSSVNDKVELFVRDIDATLVFEGDSVIEDATGSDFVPKDTVRASYLSLNDLTVLFPGTDKASRFGIDDLKSLDLGVSEPVKLFDVGFGDYVKFICSHCIVMISVDSNGTFGMDSKNKLYSEFGTGAEVTDKVEERSFYVEVFFVSATTGDRLVGANAQVVDKSGNECFSGPSDGWGSIVAELKAGDYTLNISCDGYIGESVDFTVYENGEYSLNGVIALSPELISGEIRIVLEWGSYPNDIDAYLFDSSLSRYYVNYTNQEFYINSVLYAELDVDKTTGYGPETITVYDPGVDFSYVLNDFTHTGEMLTEGNIVIKVYLPGESGPRVFTVSGTETGVNWYEVFRWENGTIVPIGQPIEMN